MSDAPTPEISTADQIEALERIVLAIAAAHIKLSPNRNAFINNLTGHLIDGLNSTSQAHQARIWPIVEKRIIPMIESLDAYYRNRS